MIAMQNKPFLWIGIAVVVVVAAVIFIITSGTKPLRDLPADVVEYAEWIKATTGGTDSAIPENMDSQTSYQFTRYGKDGEVISIAALTDEKLAERIIMDVTAKSAAWQGVDVATLTEYYLIEQSFAATEEKREYYAYLLDGKAVLQRGNNGIYSYLSQELYDKLDGIYTDAVERTEP